ncbi:restriction endonuclease subunit S [Candidatus Babeliales bacterium]|nr:restriction endonuclease subunit S [Candidatus Babeliales bacterium]
MPENWKKYNLSEVSQIIGGGTPSTKVEEYWNGEIPWLAPRDLTNYKYRFIGVGERSISKEGLINSSARLLPQNTVLLTSRAPIGYLAIAKNEICTNQGFKSFILDPEKVDCIFFYYLLKNNVEFLQSLGTGTTFSEVSASALKTVEFEFPPLDPQISIASILSSLDDKIELNLQMNQTLEAMVLESFENLNKEDNKVRLNALIELNPRISLKKGEVVKYLGMADVSEVGMSISSFINREFSSGSKFRKHDTLLARITPCLENGKTAFVNFLEEDEIAFGSTEFIVMKAKPGVSPYLVYALTRNRNFREFAIKSMTGTSGRQRVQTDRLNDFEIAKISEDEMKLFHNTVESMFEKIKQNSDQNKHLSALRDSLLPRLMSGKINID